jgi:hypothetical protein
MDDPDVIAYLFAADGVSQNVALHAIYAEENKQHFLPPRQHPEDTDPTSQEEEGLDRWGRESTAPPDSCEGERDAFPHREPCLMLRFSKPPKTRKGVVCGRNLNADIVMIHQNVSRYHFALAFDDENRLVVRDLGSRAGTCVLYDTEHREPGFGGTFSAEGPGLLRGQPPIIKILDDLQFKLVVPRHDVTSDKYLANVKRFREGSAKTEDLLADIELLSRPPTVLPTPAPGGIVADAKAPGQMMWTKEIGRGMFGAVFYAWDVQTREEYALKKPLPENPWPRQAPCRGVKKTKEKEEKKPSFRVQDWRREAKILNGLCHVSLSLRACFLQFELWLTFPSFLPHHSPILFGSSTTSSPTTINPLTSPSCILSPCPMVLWPTSSATLRPSSRNKWPSRSSRVSHTSMEGQALTLHAWFTGNE